MVPADAGAALWISVTDLAALKGVTKQTISARVMALEGAGRVETKPGKGRAKLINLASYDRAVGEVSDPSKILGAATRREIAGNTPAPADTAAGDNSYTATQARKTGYEADLKKLDLAERVGQLIPIAGPHGVTEACVRVAAAFNSAVDALPMRAPELTAVALAEGEIAVRRVLRQFAFETRAAAARALRLLETEGTKAEAAGLIETDLPLGEAVL
jgi:hypothetical protein